MRKHGKKLILFLALAIACTAVFLACSDGSVYPELQTPSDESYTFDPSRSDSGEPSVPFIVGVAKSEMSSCKNNKLFTIVRSKAELDSIASAPNYEYWDINGEHYTVNYLKKHTAKYGDEFFARGALVLYLFESGSGGGCLDVTGVQVRDDTLTVVTDFHPGALCVMTSWTVVIEVAQADIPGVTKTEVKKECNCCPFACDLILIVLTPEATRKAYNQNKTYIPADFPEFAFSRVENLFTMEPNGPDFCRILFLHLAEPSEENVLKAIGLMQKRPDVKSAEPNWKLGM